MKFRQLAALFFAASCTLSLSANAQTEQPETRQVAVQTDQIIARVNGVEILFFDLIEELAVLPPQVRNLPLEQLLGPLYPELVNRLVEKQLLVEGAVSQGLDKEDDFKRQLEVSRRTLLERLLLESLYREQITEEVLRTKYEASLASVEAPTERRARHILVKTQEEAQDLVTKLDEGADFAELAAEFSTGPTGPRGGDLGYFTPDRMVKPFADAAFSMEVGGYSASPVETRFGWHVIKVEEERQRPLPSFEDVMEEMRVQEQQRIQVELLDQLRATAQIERYSLEGDLLEP